MNQVTFGVLAEARLRLLLQFENDFTFLLKSSDQRRFAIAYLHFHLVNCHMRLKLLFISFINPHMSVVAPWPASASDKMAASESSEVMDKVSELLYALNDAMGDLEDFQVEKRQSLYDHLQAVIKCFQSLQDIAPSMTESVPVNVIQLLDQGKDPNEYAKELVACVHESHEKVKKKQMWMQHLKNSLDGLVKANFPDENLEA